MSYKITYKGIDADQVDWELEFKLNKVSNNQIEIPQGQRDIIKRALSFYISSIQNMGYTFRDDEEIHYDIFDMNQLRGMMDYPIHIDISKEEQVKFTSKYGVDFPEY
jgi:phenylalanyl-tRNA synthetase alpha subunit